MIRLFRPEDASACCSIIRACLEADDSYPSALRAKIRAGETAESMRERAELFYIAVYEEENRILGFAGLDMNEIRMLYVAPESQHRGIGRSLFEHLKTMVPDAMFPEIFVYSTIGASGFYAACGFKDKGPFVFDLGGESLPTVFMTLPVRPFP
jgi:GNAT superfamily N-acetyltransferase